jgi:hypothetical protein
VRWIDAASNATEMIYLESYRYFANKLLVCPPMRPYFLKLAVPISKVP